MEPVTKPELLARRPKPLQWALLLLLSIVFVAALELARLPAALLIWPMVAAIIAGTNGATVRPLRIFYVAAQAVVGCLIAASVDAKIFGSFYAEWPLFLGIVLATLVASSLLGYLISRWKVPPGTTAV